MTTRRKPRSLRPTAGDDVTYQGSSAVCAAPDWSPVAGWERARSGRGRTLDRIPAGPKRDRARSRIDRLHRVEGEDPTALPETVQPPDDDLVGVVSVQAVAHVLEPADRAALARADVVAARRGKQAPNPRRLPVGRILPTRSRYQRFARPKRRGGYPESAAGQLEPGGRAPHRAPGLPRSAGISKARLIADQGGRAGRDVAFSAFCDRQNDPPILRDQCAMCRHEG